MSAIEYNFKIEQGATFRRVFNWVDAKGLPKNLNNWRGRMQIREGYNKPLLITMTTENNMIKLQGSNIVLEIDKNITKEFNINSTANIMPKKTYYYDLFLYNGGITAIKFMTGHVLLIGSITNED